RLVPGVGQEFGALFEIGQDDEAIRLETVGGGRENEGAFERLPDFGGKFFGFIKAFGRVAPFECFYELLGTHILGGCHAMKKKQAGGTCWPNTRSRVCPRL